MDNMYIAIITFYAVFSAFMFVCFLLFYTDPIQSVWTAKRRLKWVSVIFLISAFWFPLLVFALVLVSIGVIQKETK